MKSFIEMVKEWDQEDFNRRHQFADLPLDLKNLPVTAEVFEGPSPIIQNDVRFYVHIDFARYTGATRHYTTIIIPYGRERALTRGEAQAEALNIIAKNKDRYTNVYAYHKTKFTGRSFFNEESDREYFKPR